MNRNQLPSVSYSHKKPHSNMSIPQGKITPHQHSGIPVITRLGSHQPISMRQINNDQHIDEKLKSLSQRTNNPKFLRYKFDPSKKQGEQITLRGQSGNEDVYGQLGGGTKQKISINIFQQRRNILFQDNRAPFVYKKLFIEQQEG